MATLSEHVASVQAALQAARDDGYLIEWDFSHTDWWGELEVSEVRAGLYRNRRDADGIMRVEERANFLEAYI